MSLGMADVEISHPSPLRCDGVVLIGELGIDSIPRHDTVRTALTFSSQPTVATARAA